PRRKKTAPRGAARAERPKASARAVRVRQASAVGGVGVPVARGVTPIAPIGVFVAAERATVEVALVDITVAVITVVRIDTPDDDWTLDHPSRPVSPDRNEPRAVHEAIA